jgi:hypothetical protein
MVESRPLAVLAAPPPMVADWPLALLFCPPLMVDKMPLATLGPPPPMVAKLAPAVLPEPPLTVLKEPLTVLPVPSLCRPWGKSSAETVPTVIKRTPRISDVIMAICVSSLHPRSLQYRCAILPLVCKSCNIGHTHSFKALLLTKDIRFRLS